MLSVSERIIVGANAVTMEDAATLRAQLRSFFQTLERIAEADQVLKSLTDHALKIGLEARIQDKKGQAKPHKGGWIQMLADDLPTRLDRASFQQEALGFIINSEGDSFRSVFQITGMVGSGVASSLEYLRKEVFLPLVAFYLEEASQHSQVFRLLGLYKRTVEWFDRAELCAKCSEEKHFEDHLRRFLLQHGIANPFSQTVAARGARQDITFYEDEHPVPIEVKYQEDQPKVASEVAKGVRQAYRYAESLGSSTCYFVMFSKAKKQLLFEGARPGRPFYVRGGIGIYCVAINLDLDSPSKVPSSDAPLVLREADVFADWSN